MQYPANYYQQPPQPQQQRKPPGAGIILVLALLYWISPIDLIPFIPIDDIIVIVGALLYQNIGGGNG